MSFIKLLLSVFLMSKWYYTGDWVDYNFVLPVA
jgi:hypothetical protein